jgi:choline dehydrogenase-like flavoprotein
MERPGCGRYRAHAVKDQQPGGAVQPVIVVGAGPVGATAALLLADAGFPATLLERHLRPHPLPRAGHLDDEVARTLHQVGVSEGFLARSRPGSGLRLLDARHRVMAEFRRDLRPGVNGFPQANMFHQPDLDALLLARVGRHPLISFFRGAAVFGPDTAPGPLTAACVQVAAPLPGAQVRRCAPSPDAWSLAATERTARSGTWPRSPWRTRGSPSAGWSSMSGPLAASTAGTARNRWATPSWGCCRQKSTPIPGTTDGACSWDRSAMRDASLRGGRRPRSSGVKHTGLSRQRA